MYYFVPIALTVLGILYETKTTGFIQVVSDRKNVRFDIKIRIKDHLHQALFSFSM